MIFSRMKGFERVINIEDIKTLKLAPGQVLVVKVNCEVSKEIADRIKLWFETDIPIVKNRILIIDKRISLSVLDATEVETEIKELSDGESESEK